MPQFFINAKFERGKKVDIKGSDARHISQVLRLKTGDWIVLSDGTGKCFRTTIVAEAYNKVTVQIESEISKKQDPMAPVLALSLIKKDRFEWALQKSVELGISHVIPVITTRTNIKLTPASDRWKKIAVEAAKQSGLPFVPEVAAPVKFTELCKEFKKFAGAVVFYEGEKKNDISSFWEKRNTQTKPDIIVIGPEGGLTKYEILEAKSAGAAVLTLGTQILRVETAAVAALAIWQYEKGKRHAK